MTLDPRPFHEWHEDIGDVIWWLWPIEQAPYVGTPLDLGAGVAASVSLWRHNGVPEKAQTQINVGGWPWRDAGDDTEARLFWTPLPDISAIDEAIRDHIRGGPDPFKDPTHES